MSARADFFTREALRAAAEMLCAIAEGRLADARDLGRRATTLALCAQAARSCDRLSPPALAPAAPVPPSTEGGG